MTSVAFSPDGQTLAGGEYERGVTLWDPHTLKEKCKLSPFDPLSETKGVVRVAFSPTGNVLAIAANHAKQGGFVTVWASDSAGNQKGRHDSPCIANDQNSFTVREFFV